MARKKVLVVDDEKNQREIYTLILEDDGYQVTTAQSGEQALRFAREKPFDLVLTDYKMAGHGWTDAIERIAQAGSVYHRGDDDCPRLSRVG